MTTPGSFASAQLLHFSIEDGRNRSWGIDEKERQEGEEDGREGGGGSGAFSRVSVPPWEESDSFHYRRGRGRGAGGDEERTDSNRRRSVSVGGAIDDGSERACCEPFNRKKFTSPPLYLSRDQRSMRVRDEEEENGGTEGGGGQGQMSLGHEQRHRRHLVDSLQERERFVSDRKSLFLSSELHNLRHDEEEEIQGAGSQKEGVGRGGGQRGWAFRISSSIFPLFRYRGNMRHSKMSIARDRDLVSSSSSSCRVHPTEFAPLSQLDIQGGGGRGRTRQGHFVFAWDRSCGGQQQRRSYKREIASLSCCETASSSLHCLVYLLRDSLFNKKTILRCEGRRTSWVGVIHIHLGVYRHLIPCLVCHRSVRISAHSLESSALCWLKCLLSRFGGLHFGVRDLFLFSRSHFLVGNQRLIACRRLSSSCQSPDRTLDPGGTGESHGPLDYQPANR